MLFILECIADGFPSHIELPFKSFRIQFFTSLTDKNLTDDWHRFCRLNPYMAAVHGQITPAQQLQSAVNDRAFYN